jgi:hypothetical protein
MVDGAVAPELSVAIAPSTVFKSDLTADPVAFAME